MSRDSESLLCRPQGLLIVAAVALQAIIKPGQDVFAVNACYNKPEQLVFA